MSLTAQHSNHELLHMISEGDHQAFDILFERFHTQMLRTATKWSKSPDAASDIIQETFMGLWASREKLATVQDPPAYLYTALFYTINRWLRQEENRKKILSLPWPADSVNTTEQEVNFRDNQRLVNNALEKLTPQKQLIYRLKKEEGHSHEEIASMLHLSPHTVKGYMKETIKFIRLHLKNAAMGLFSFLF